MIARLSCSLSFLSTNNTTSTTTKGGSGITRRAGLLFLLLLPLLLGGCWRSSPETTEGTTKPACISRDTLVINIATEPPTLDPARMTDVVSFQVLQNLMQGLTRLDEQARIQPALAQHWQVLDNGRRYRFTLRPNLRWSDGQPLTTNDFVYAWQRALTPATGSQYASLLFPVKNARAFYAGQLKDFNAVGIQAINSRVLDVTLEHPLAFFLDLMAFPVAMPLRQDRIIQHGAAFTEAAHFVVNGPFRLAQWHHDSHLVLRPNPYYWGPKPTMPVRLVMVPDGNTALGLYDQGQLDYVANVPSVLTGQILKRPDAQRLALNAVYYLGFNVDKPPLSDGRVRQAFAYAVDRDLLTRLQNSGQVPISGLIPPEMTGYSANEVGLTFHPEKARHLLAQAGYPNGKGFPTVTLAVPNTFEQRREAEVLQWLWKTHLHVDVRIQLMEWKLFLSQLATDPPHLFRLSWFADYPDPDTMVGLFTSASGNNYTGWHHPGYDALVQQAVALTQWSQRAPLYEQAQRLLLQQETVIVPLYAYTKVWLVQPWVRRLQVNSMNQLLLESAERLPCSTTP